MPFPENHRPTEPEPVPYHKAARFARERAAWRVYAQLQAAVFAAPDCDLSVYRLQLDRVYHVAVLGEPPLADLDRRIDALLAQGELVPLPREALLALSQRRRQMTRRGGWSKATTVQESAYERNAAPGVRPLLE